MNEKRQLRARSDDGGARPGPIIDAGRPRPHGSFTAKEVHDMRSGIKLTALALFAVCLISSGSARADTISDPLLGHCLAGCADNGTNTPISGPW
jgi:hypothetical protein